MNKIYRRLIGSVICILIVTMLAAIIGVTVKLYHRTAEIRETQMRSAAQLVDSEIQKEMQNGMRN